MFGIVASPNSTTKKLSELKAKQVAISRATIIEYLLDRFLDASGKPSDFVQKQEIKKIPIRLQMLLADQVPAALLPEPLLTLAESKGATVLVDDRILKTTLTVLAMPTRKDPAGGERAQRFLRAYRRAVAAINQNPEAFKELLVTRTRFPMPIKDRYRVPVFPPVAVPKPSDIQDAQTWLVKNNMMPQPMPYQQIVYKP